MIRINELRVGNWVSFDSGATNLDRIGQITVEEFDCFSPSGERENIYPIPLSPEILEKCGLEWDIFWQGFADSRGVIFLQKGNTEKGYNVW
jgi:hypothetical protein